LHKHLVSEVLHGGARGADRLGFRWAVKHHIRSRCFAADWQRFGKAAEPRRNQQLAQAGDMLLAFWDGRSPGTRHIIGCMHQLGKPVVVVRFDTTA
jgi:YspA, cpYpsA-related SLOG family